MNRRSFIAGFAPLSAVALTGCGDRLSAAAVVGSGTSSLAADQLRDFAATAPSGGNGFFDVKVYGAAGDGTQDDTAMIQNAINAAQNIGGVVFFPPGTYKISAPLNISSRVQISGCGYEGDGGAAYNGRALLKSNGFRSSTIICGAHNCINAMTDQSIFIEGIQIVYPVRPPASTVAIRIQSAANSTSLNIFSRIRDIYIDGHAVGIQLINCLDFVLDNCNLLAGWQGGIHLSSPNYPSYGDSTITNCTIWGHGVPDYNFHIGVFSGGGLRVINNKFNVGSGTSTCGILIQPSLTGNQTVEPLLIANNSIEGCAVGVCFNNANPLATCTEVSITGNQIWSGTNTILANTYSTDWLVGLSITGNSLMVNGEANPKNIMVLDSASIGVITGNSFVLAFGGTGNGLVLGSKTKNINVQSNVYGPGVNPVYNTAGNANKIGGGSM